MRWSISKFRCRERSKEKGKLSINFQMSTIRLYEAYIQLNLASTRKALEKKLSNKDMSSEGNETKIFFSRRINKRILLDFLSIPPKQFLQILSQVQVRLDLLFQR